VVQKEERQPVVLEVSGSSPLGHPILLMRDLGSRRSRQGW
jgi:hypothetical protein